MDETFLGSHPVGSYSFQDNGVLGIFFEGDLVVMLSFASNNKKPRSGWNAAFLISC